MATFDDFWGRMSKAAPGLFDLGVGAYGRNQAEKEASQRLRTAQGPLYDTQMAGAQRSLDQAGSMDPRALGKERFDAAQGMLAGTDAASMDDLMRRLRGAGQMDIASFSGQQGGPAVNPQMAAYFKAKADRDAKMAYDSLNQGDDYLDRLVRRGGMLQGQAAGTQRTGLEAQRTQPSRAAGNLELLKGAGSILKDTGLLGTGVDWLKRQFGGFGSPLPTGGFEFGFGDDWN